MVGVAPQRQGRFPSPGTGSGFCPISEAAPEPRSAPTPPANNVHDLWRASLGLPNLSQPANTVGAHSAQLPGDALVARAETEALILSALAEGTNRQYMASWHR